MSYTNLKRTFALIFALLCCLPAVAAEKSTAVEQSSLPVRFMQQYWPVIALNLYFQCQGPKDAPQSASTRTPAPAKQTIMAPAKRGGSVALAPAKRMPVPAKRVQAPKAPAKRPTTALVVTGNGVPFAQALAQAQQRNTARLQAAAPIELEFKPSLIPKKLPKIMVELLLMQYLFKKPIKWAYTPFKYCLEALAGCEYGSMDYYKAGWLSRATLLFFALDFIKNDVIRAYAYRLMRTAMDKAQQEITRLAPAQVAYVQGVGQSINDSLFKKSDQ